MNPNKQKAKKVLSLEDLKKVVAGIDAIHSGVESPSLTPPTKCDCFSSVWTICR